MTSMIVLSRMRKLEKEDFTSLLLFLWQLWEARNFGIIQRKTISPQDALIHARTVHKGFRVHSLLCVSLLLRGSSTERWEALNGERFKINVDVAWWAKKQAATFGAVVRDCKDMMRVLDSLMVHLVLVHQRHILLSTSSR
ncbi:hypothetical protein GOBAR_DD10469 [Gossypium barbadense]|nr:hypothetical protein GOBAR_DD10469 [Gossypium barbadense]